MMAGRKKCPPQELRQVGECICAAPAQLAQPEFLSGLPYRVSSRQAAEIVVAEVVSEFFLPEWDSAVPKAGQGSCPELCAWMGVAMQRIIYVPGAVLQTWPRPRSWQTSKLEWIPPEGPPNLDVKISLLTGKLACSSQSQQCYGRVSTGTGSSVMSFSPPRLSVFPKFVLICLGDFFTLLWRTFFFP